MTYLPGHVKRDPSTGDVAVRTTFAEDRPTFAAMAWMRVSPSRGTRHVGTDDVANWTDLYTPEGTP